MIVEKIFGKDISSINKDDLENIVGIPESYNIEFKSIPDIDPILNSYKKKKNIIKKIY